MRQTLTFTSEGTTCGAWYYPATTEDLACSAGRPALVMGHGFGATKDTGLDGFASALAEAGVGVLAFDYRGFGASEGLPRQVISLRGQVEDFRAAVSAVAHLPGIDPSRLALWGVSLGGGTILEVAAGQPEIAAVISLTPFVSGLAGAQYAVPNTSTSSSLRSLGAAARAKIATLRGRPQVVIPLVGGPDEGAMLTSPGAAEQYLAIAGPTWRNEVDARIVFEMVQHRPIRHAHKMPCPALFQIADHDNFAPPYAAQRAAVKARALVHHYPCDHFDVFPGNPWHEAVVRDQVRFLRRVLAPPAATTKEQHA